MHMVRQRRMYVYACGLWDAGTRRGQPVNFVIICEQNVFLSAVYWNRRRRQNRTLHWFSGRRERTKGDDGRAIIIVINM